MNSPFDRDIVTETAEGNARRVASEVELNRDIIANIRSKKIKADRDLGSALHEKTMRKISEDKLSRAINNAADLLLDRDALISTIKFLQGKWAPGKRDEFIKEAKAKSESIYMEYSKNQLKVDDAHERIEKNVNNKNYRPGAIPRSEYSKKKTKR